MRMNEYKKDGQKSNLTNGTNVKLMSNLCVLGHRGLEIFNILAKELVLVQRLLSCRQMLKLVL